MSLKAPIMGGILAGPANRLGRRPIKTGFEHIVILETSVQV